MKTGPTGKCEMNLKQHFTTSLSLEVSPERNNTSDWRVEKLHSSMELTLWCHFSELMSTLTNAFMLSKPWKITKGNPNNYEWTDYFSWSKDCSYNQVQLLYPAVMFCPKQIFTSASVLLQTFNFSSAVAWTYTWLHHSEIMRSQCQACGQIHQSEVTQWQESQSWIWWFNPRWRRANETCFTARIVWCTECNYDVMSKT